MRTATPLALAALIGGLFPSAASAATPFASATSSDLVPALVIAGAGALVIMLIMIVVPGARRGASSSPEGDEAPTVTAFRAHPIDAPSVGAEADTSLLTVAPPAAEPAPAIPAPAAAAPEPTPEPEPAPAIPAVAAAAPEPTPEPEPAPAIPAVAAAAPEPAPEPEPAPAIPAVAAAAPEPEPAPAVAAPIPDHVDPEPVEELHPVFAGLQPAHAAEMTGATAEMTLLFAEAIAPERAMVLHATDPTVAEPTAEEDELLREDEPHTGAEIFRAAAPPSPADEDSEVAVLAGERGAVAVADPPRAATAASSRPAPPPAAAPAPDLLSALSPAAVLGDSFDTERLRDAIAEEPAPAPLGHGWALGPEPDARTVLRDHSLTVPVAACVLVGVAVHLVRSRRRR